MSVPLSNIVNVSISAAATPVGSAGFGNLLFLSPEGKDTQTESTRVTQHQTLADVTKTYPSATHPEIAAAAASYYAQVPKPLNFWVGTVLDNSTAATLESGDISGDLATIKAVTAGALDINIDGGALSLTGLDFSGAADLDAVATVLQTALDAALTGVTITFNGTSLIITSPVVGQGSSVDFATGSGDQTILKLTEAAGAVEVAAVLPETATEAFNACVEFVSGITGLVTDRTYRDGAEVPKLSLAAGGHNVIFGNTTNDPKVLTSEASSTIAGGLTHGKTISSYCSTIEAYPSCSVLGRIFTVNYGGTNTAITLMFKQLPGLPVENMSATQKSNMEKVNVNAFLRVGGANMYTESRMADRGYLDTVHGLMWLEAQIQLNVFNLLYGTTTKIPYNDTGIAMVANQVEAALVQGVRNGLLSAGNDSNGDYVPAGYVVTTIPVADIPSSDKGNRIYKGCSFICVGAGALHGVTITGSFNE